MTDDPSGHAPAGTRIDSQDTVRPLLQDDLPPDPPPAFAGVVVVAQGQGRPCDLCELLSIMRAAALEHGCSPVIRYHIVRRIFLYLRKGNKFSFSSRLFLVYFSQEERHGGQFIDVEGI